MRFFTMSKQQILEKLYEKKGEETDSLNKERIDNICNILHIMPDIDILKEIPEIENYINGTSSKLSNDLETILNKLKCCISSNTYSIANNAIEIMNKNTRFFLNIFLAVIAVLAIVAVVFTVLNLIYGQEFLNGWGDKIAGALGTLDFTLGAIGFIIERKDDMKKREIHIAAQEAKESGSSEKFANMLIKNITKNSYNSSVKVGKVGGDVVQGDKTINNIRK